MSHFKNDNYKFQFCHRWSTQGDGARAEGWSVGNQDGGPPLEASGDGGFTLGTESQEALEAGLQGTQEAGPQEMPE